MMAKKRKILAICNTPFQIVIASHILHTYYKDSEVDILVSDGIRGGEQLADNARKTNAFRRVLYIHNRKTFLTEKGWMAKIRYARGRAGEVIRCHQLARTLANERYDELLFTNISILTKLLTTSLLRVNPQCKICIFEEGMITYTQTYAAGDAPHSLYRRLCDREGLLAKVSRVYLRHPEFLRWDVGRAQIFTLPPINPNDWELISMLNKIFDYEHCPDRYDRRIIFFEESHNFEGFNVPDVDIVNRMAEKVGKENIMIKIHPRNPVNRFAELGYKTNKDTAVPWEIIMLNEHFSDTIFVTISSGAVVAPYLYLDMQSRCYSLLNCLEHRPGYMNGDLGDIMNQLYASSPDIFIAPTSLNDFLQQL